MIKMLTKKYLLQLPTHLQSEILSFCCIARKLDCQVKILIEEDLNYHPSISSMVARTPKELRTMKATERETFVVPKYYIDILT